MSLCSSFCCDYHLFTLSTSTSIFYLHLHLLPPPLSYSFIFLSFSTSTPFIFYLNLFFISPCLCLPHRSSLSITPPFFPPPYSFLPFPPSTSPLNLLYVRCASICDKLTQLGYMKSRVKEENPYIIDDSVPFSAAEDDEVDASATPPPPPFPRGSSMNSSNRKMSVRNGGVGGTVVNGVSGGGALPTTPTATIHSRPLPTLPAENVYEEVRVE